jgi:hypothetical protein
MVARLFILCVFVISQYGHAGFCEKAFTGLSVRLESAISSEKNLRFRGIHGISEKEFEAIEKEGMHSAVVRAYSAYSKTSMAMALNHFQYLNTMPKDLMSFLAYANKYELFVDPFGNSLSPFVSTSRSPTAAAKFGPLWFQEGQNIFPQNLDALYSINVNKFTGINIPRGKELRRIRKLIGAALDPDELEKLRAPEKVKAIEIRDWLVAHRWLHEITGLLKYDDSHVNQNAWWTFKRLFEDTGYWLHDLQAIGERETAGVLFIPAEAIERGRLYQGGKLILERKAPGR